MSAAEDPAAGRLEGLLTQHAWVRVLARTLVRDDADADDLTQEAWLAALRSPPTGRGSVRGWFGTVLRNAARQAHRGKSRRERREDASARPEGLPSSHEIVARAEEHRRVVDAVLTLEEPYRTTVLLRFFDELPPRDVAARMGVPVETARARVRRALERLREKLDEAHGGGGHAWKLALMPLAGIRAELVTAAAASGSKAAAAKSAAVAGTKAGAASATTPAVTSAMTAGALTMGAMSTVAVGVVALAAGATIVWAAGSGDRDALAKALQDVDAAKADVVSARTDAEKARADAKRKDEKIAEIDAKRNAAVQAQAEAEARAAKAKEELAAARDDLAKAQPSGSAPPKPRGPAISFPQYADVLATVDWKSVGEHTSAMPPLLEELAAAVRDGKPMPPKAAGDIQKHNGPLVTAALQLMDKLPGTGANGAFSHPAFVVNALVVALEQAGKPLSAAQRTAIEDLGRRFTDEETRRVASYNDATFQMQKLVEEGALKNRLYDSLRAALSTEQLNAISPPALRDRTSIDIWSEGILWATVTRPVSIADRAKFEETVARQAGGFLKLDDAQKAKAAGIVADWTSRLPQDLVSRKTDALERQGWMPSDTVAVAAAETRKLVERLANDLSLSSEQTTAARGWGMVVYPLPGAGGGGDE